MKYNWNPWARENWSASEAEWNNPSLPMISIGVLNYNRCAELRQTLDVLTHAVQYPNYEIIVVDNGSKDGSVEMMRSEYPHIRLHETGKNLGVSARNFQTRLARGKYLFSFDNDSMPGTPSTILRIVKHMEQNLKIDSLSMMCYQPLSGITETNGWEHHRLGLDPRIGIHGIYLVEGGVCFRLESLRRVAGYDRRIVYGADGPDLALQLYQQGFQTFLCPWFVTLHFASPQMRIKGYRAYANSRHTIWMIAKHWPMTATIFLFACLVLRRFIAMAMHPPMLNQNAKGLRDGFWGIQPFLHYRPKLTWKQVFGLKRFYLSLYRWA